MPETDTQNTTNGQSSNADSSRHPTTALSTANRPRLRWPLAVLLMVVIAAGILKLYTDWEISRLEQEQQRAQQELQRQASIQKLLVGTLSADRIEADESNFETLQVSGRATIEELMARTADIENLRAGNLRAEEGDLDTLLVRGARITDGFRVSGDTTLANLLLKGRLGLTGNTEDMVLLEPGGNDQSVFSVRTPSGEETANLNARGDLRLAGDADIGGVLRVSRNAAFNADVLTKGGLMVQKSVQFQDSLAVEQNTTLNGNLTVNDSTRLRDSLFVQGPLEVGEDATFKSDVRMEQNQDVQGQLTAGTMVSTGTTDLQGPIFNTSSNNDGRVYVDDDFEVTGTMYGTNLVMSGSVTQGNTTVNNLTVLGTADFLGPVTMSDELTIGPNTLYADPVNNRVGIGTDAPSQLLHVAGNALVDNDLTVSGSASIANNLDAGGNLTVSGSGAFAGTVSGADASTNNQFVTLGQLNDGSDTSTSTFVQGGNSFGVLATLGTNDTNALAFETNGTERMRIDTSGNVGIGFTAPNVPLEVSDTLRVSKSNDQNRGLNIHLGFSGRVHFTSRGVSGSGFSFRYSNYNILGLGNSGNHNNAIFGNSTDVILSPTGTATGTTQHPSNNLVLQGSAWDSTNSTAENRAVSLKTITGSGTDGNEPYRLAVLNNAGNEFVTFDGSNQRLGIGMSSPGYKLTVAGDIGLTSAGNTLTTPATELVLEQTGDAHGTTRLRLQNRNGMNGALFENSSLDLVDFAFKPSSGAQQNIRYEHRSSLVYSGNSGGQFEIGPGGDPNLFVGTGVSGFRNGNVGIGTTNPGARLQVNTNGGGKVGQIIKGADSQSADLLQARDSTGTILASIDSGGNLSVKNATVNGTLTVNGVAVVDGVQTSIATKTADYTLTDSDSAILADASGGAVTITLPSAVGREGREFTVKKIDGSTNNVVLATDGTETIDGASSKAVSSENHYIQVVSDGSNWFIIGIAPSL